MADEQEQTPPDDPNPGPATQEETTTRPASAEGTAAPVLKKVPVIGAIAGLVVLIAAGTWYWYSRSAPPSPVEVERLLRKNDLEEAERLARALYESEPANPNYAFLLARVLAASDKLQEAATLLEGLELSGVARAEALLRAAQCWLRAHYRRKAEATFQKCLDVQADDVIRLPAIHQSARRELAGIYATERRTADLRRITWVIYEESPPEQRASALASRIRYDFEMVDPRVAIASLEPAIQVDPSDVYSRRAIGFYYLELGDAARARPYLIRCIQDAPENPLMWETWLHCLVRVADTILAERYLEQIPPSTESSPLCWRYRAQLLDLLGRAEEAVAAARKAVELDPYDPENHYQLGQMLIRVGQRDEAESHVRRSQELQSILQQLRDTFERFRQEWPTLVEPQERCDLAIELARLCEQLGRVRDAYGWYTVALHEVPNHAVAIEARRKLEDKLLDPNLPY